MNSLKRPTHAIAGLALLFALIGLPTAKTFAAPTIKRPNLLIIQTDEHNFRTLGCYRKHLSKDQALMWGSSVVETPRIDSLAKEGAICTSFYATTPVCSPSRGSMVTGRYPQNTPVTTNNIPLSDDVTTFAQILSDAGYATGFAGKWHLDGSGKPQWAPERKFGFQDNRYMFNRGHWKQLEDTPQGPRVAARDKRGIPSYAIAGANKQNFTTDFLCDKTIEFIQTNKARPFCYWVSLPDPHGPDTVRAPYDTMFDEQEYEHPRTFNSDPRKKPSWGQPQGGGLSQAKYYGMVRCIDDNVGKILDTLTSLEILDNTIIVFTSDHGDLRGEHHRQNKGVPYEGSVRIPMLVRYPQAIAAGTVINQALSCVDFQPTVLNLMNVKACGEEEGRDASDLFRSSKKDIEWEDVAFIRGTGGETGWLSAFSDRYKLVYSPNDPPWLFDLERDPDELTNFFTHPGYREVVQRMAKQLKEYTEKYNDPFINVPRIKHDVDWSINGKGEYQSPPASNATGTANKKNRKKKPKK